MQNIRTTVELVFDIGVQKESWAGHKEAENKCIGVLEALFREGIDNFITGNIKLRDIEIVSTEER